MRPVLASRTHFLFGTQIVDNSQAFVLVIDQLCVAALILVAHPRLDDKDACRCLAQRNMQASAKM